ncbi:hypothetical protein WR25_12311 isoform B [Diploscapter pachys]|uniref:Replication protein A subunit n=1 Tax=Diploscapter pachys TaxID=2018661 RepID=A0A2A2JVC0_9BILA|nr:hypothetical protein WR25_12311 isoform A [Diploscapter pachys]PAV65619.1 hypothetical protein WR25_12311 isoform B [Diploscapter pachys]
MEIRYKIKNRKLISHYLFFQESFKGFKPQSSIGIPWGGSESGDMGEPAAKRTKPLSEQTNRIVPPMSTSVSGGGPLAGLASVTPIKSLSPYLQRWKIHGLVTNREELRAIKSKAGKDLRIFSFEIADKNGDKIRITGFDAEADKASTQIQQGQTYFIANGAVKTANKQWNYTGCDYEITLNRTSEITPSYDDKIEKPAFRLRICPLKDIPAHNGETVDVLVIVTEVGEAVNFTSRTNKDLTKRDLTVVDKSGTETQIILWGDVAKGFDPEAKGQVVGFKGYAVKEYQGGYSLSSGFSASEYVLTPSLPEVAELYEWKDGEMGTTTFQKITVTGGSNLLTNQRPLRLMQSLRLGDNASGAAEFVTIHADIVRIKPENSLYKACPSPDCKKKVVDVDGSYRCEKCGHTTQNFKWLYLLQSEISDGTASVYATIFSPVADQIIGKSADELGNIMEADHNEFMQILSDAYLKPYTFRIKAKSEFYNDENRMKYVVMKAANRDYATYNQLLLNTIAKLDAITV